MLVLTRKVDEVISIGKDIKVKVLKICGKQVRIGISAPKHITVVREEIEQSSPENRQLLADES